MADICKFADLINSDNLWPRMCVRDFRNDKPFADGWGCTSNSYFNLSGQHESFVRDDMEFNQERVQDIVNRTYEYVVKHNNQGRSFVSKKMTEDNPYSQYYSSLFFVTDDIFDSKIVEVGLGRYKEVKVKTYNATEIENIRFKFEDRIYQNSQNFSSDHVEIVAMTISYHMK